MGELPRQRLEVFSSTFSRSAEGPIDVGCGGNGTLKRYGALFICLTIRAARLERAAFLSTDDILH